MDSTVKIGKHTISLTNLKKILFPNPNITKSNLIDYYTMIAPTMLPYLKNRALTMVRYPDGITHEGFFHKNAPDYFPDWIKTKRVKHSDGYVNYVVCNNQATLVYLSNYGTISMHTWLSTIRTLHYPDTLIFDLDPSGSASFATIKKLAIYLKELLQEIKLVPFVKTTGSRGLHVTIPIKPLQQFDTVKTFARDIAHIIIKQYPNLATLEMRKKNRGNKIFVDVLRNEFAQTAVAPYSIRAKKGAPIATPLEWEELDDKHLKSTSYTIKNITKRLESVGDPWKGWSRHARTLTNAQRILKKLS